MNRKTRREFRDRSNVKIVLNIHNGCVIRLYLRQKNFLINNTRRPEPSWTGSLCLHQFSDWMNRYSVF